MRVYPSRAAQSHRQIGHSNPCGENRASFAFRAHKIKCRQPYWFLICGHRDSDPTVLRERPRVTRPLPGRPVLPATTRTTSTIGTCSAESSRAC